LSDQALFFKFIPEILVTFLSSRSKNFGLAHLYQSLIRLAVLPYQMFNGAYILKRVLR